MRWHSPKLVWLNLKRVCATVNSVQPSNIKSLYPIHLSICKFPTIEWNEQGYPPHYVFSFSINQPHLCPPRYRRAMVMCKAMKFTSHVPITPLMSMSRLTYYQQLLTGSGGFSSLHWSVFRSWTVSLLGLLPSRLEPFEDCAVFSFIVGVSK